MLHSEKWKQGGTTQPMLRHMQKFHRELLDDEPDRKSATTVSQPLFKEKWNTGDELKADENFMSEHPDFQPKTLTLRIDVRWNALYAQLQSIYEQREQIEKFVNSVQHLRAADRIPLLDAEYWTLLEEHMAIMQLFLRVNLLITVEDKPTLAPLLVCVAMLKCLLGPTSDLALSRMARRARSAEHACTDEVIWTKKDAQLHRLTRSVRAMLLKDLSARYDLDDESSV